MAFGRDSHRFETFHRWPSSLICTHLLDAAPFLKVIYADVSFLKEVKRD